MMYLDPSEYNPSFVMLQTRSFHLLPFSTELWLAFESSTIFSSLSFPYQYKTRPIRKPPLSIW
jgi:hypothetical protein